VGDFLRASELATLGAPATSDAQAKSLIAMAEAQVRAFCGWHISQETVTAQILEPRCSTRRRDYCRCTDTIGLPTLHLTAVAAVVESTVTLVAGTSYRWSPDGELRRMNGRWSCIWQAITATYTHGYPSGSPELLIAKQVVLSMASRLLESPDQRSTGYTAGIVQETFAAPPQVPSGLTYAEQGALAPLMLYVVA
jgi:hypothetical protein